MAWSVIEPATSRSRVQRANHSATLPLKQYFGLRRQAQMRSIAGKINGTVGLESPDYRCKEASPRGWNPQFRIQGQLYHLIGSLHADGQNPPSFLQIYFLNDDDQVARRKSFFDGLLHPVLLDIQESLKEHHKYAKEIRCAYEFAASQDLQDFSIIIKESARHAGTHPGRYNKPDFKEVAVRMPK
ncbi:DNA helicase [Elysia marginata]|uniref:DNA helicase n=1 Tax=Elysia marginata TaxID=1093978 RepID=A0AAV4JMV5_9GAST|nr:DNA helicase [Elysia marginata]